MTSTFTSRKMLAGGALLLACTVCIVTISLSSPQVSVELNEKASAQSEISRLIRSMTGTIDATKSASKVLHPVTSLSRKDYSPQQMKEVAKRIRLAEKHEQVGYLRSGDDLPGMPIQLYEGTDKHGHYTVRGQCEELCLDNTYGDCKGYTYLTTTGKCYLKSAVRPGLNTANACKDNDCWYFGVITGKQ